MKNKKILLAVPASLILISGIALAQGKANLFERADRNGDGKVTKAEALAVEDARFTELDTNKDGYLTHDEMRAAFAKHRGEKGDKKARGGERPSRKAGAEGAQHRGPKGPHRGDTDGDGKISRVESKAMAEAFFSRIDQDGNGVITKEEAAAARSAHGKSCRQKPQDKSS